MHSRDQWHCWDVMLSSNGEEGKRMKLESIEIHNIDGIPRCALNIPELYKKQWSKKIKKDFSKYINGKHEASSVSHVPKSALVTCGLNVADQDASIVSERLFRWQFLNSHN